MLITELGYFALVVAFVLAIMQVLLPTLGIFRHNIGLQRLAPSLAYAQFAMMMLSFIGLMAGFYYNDFSLAYVTQHSNTLLPWYYRVSATWGGHEGSLLLWMTILATWAALVSFFSRGLPLSMRARVLVIMAGVQTMMLAMLIFTSSPFTRTLPHLLVDGVDLNPILQDPGLIIHPPMLYMGYVGMVVPFAFCMAALWAGRLDAVWTRWSRPWTQAAWGFLTIGIALGSWWAYYELGWGGWWFWDPVENASLMPWLAGTALLHSLAVTEKRGVFKAWTIMLAIFTFALSLLGTFLVRSGVITSVHSFAADPTRGLVILVILAIVIGGGLFMFALRGWQLTVESQYRTISRESFLVINNVIILVATLVVLLGTLYPIIADAFSLGEVSVGAPYFNALFVPLTWLLMLAMGMGTNIRWKKETRPLLGPALVIAVSSAVLGAIISYFVYPVAMFNIAVTIALSLWILAWMFIDIKDKTKNAKSRLSGIRRLKSSYWGMQTAHLGVLIAAIGIAVTSSMSIETDVAMGIGDSVNVQGYDFEIASFKEVKASNFDATEAEVLVSKDGKFVATLRPQKRTYVVSMMPITEAAINGRFTRDLYVALGEPIAEDSNQWAVRIYVKPLIRWIWLGSIIMALGVVLSMFDRRYRLKPKQRMDRAKGSDSSNGSDNSSVTEDELDYGFHQDGTQTRLQNQQQDDSPQNSPTATQPATKSVAEHQHNG